MRFCPILILFGLASTPAYAQFDYGLAFGGARTQMRAIQRDDPHASAGVSDAAHSVSLPPCSTANATPTMWTSALMRS